jgi:hypothetical protein
MMIMNTWKKSSITFSVATALLLSGLALPLINTANAAPQKQAVQPVNNKHIATLKQTKTLATAGKTINSENFGLGSAGKDIVKKWGKPSDGDKDYLRYDKRKIFFQLKSSKVDLIQSRDNRYNGITYNEVVKTLGKPVKQYFEEDSGDHGYVKTIYKTGKRTLAVCFYYKVGNTTQIPTTIEFIEVR